MECSHLSQSGTVGSISSLAQTLADKKTLECSVCHCRESLWFCVSCGQINCGRYVKAHGLDHFEKTKKKHAVCMEVKETSVFCYLCDDFVINDTSDGRLDAIRTLLQTSQSQTGNEDSKPETPSSGQKKTADRSLRPRRKRAQSSEERAGVENRPATKRARKEVAAQKQQLKSLVGLRNLGNTCFMSAVLQSLSNIHEFCQVLKQLPSLDGAQINHVTSSSSASSSASASPSSTGSGNGRPVSSVNGSGQRTPTNKRETRNNPIDGAIMTEELRKVLVALSQGQNKKAISPEALFHVIWKVVPRFRGYQQQDAHEFLRYMLDRLHTELLALLPGDLAFLQKNLSPYSRRISKGLSQSSHSLVTSIFGGMLQSEVSCLVCNTSSKKHDPFLDLSIDIPNNFIQYRKSKDKEGKESPKCQLHDCLRKFTDIEELADSERFFCGRCNRKQPSTKKFWIRRLPNVLCLHIKRFRWSPYSRTKIDTHVEFPLDSLDMSSYLLNNLHETRCSNAGSSMYDLAAAIVHHGSGAGSGHYTAFVIKNNHWFHFNDSNVVATDEETVAKSKAYILFYIQREFKLPAPS